MMEIKHAELLLLTKKAIAAARQLHVHVRGCGHCLEGDDENQRCARARRHAQDALQAVLVHVDEEYTPNDPKRVAGARKARSSKDQRKVHIERNRAILRESY